MLKTNFIAALHWSNIFIICCFTCICARNWRRIPLYLRSVKPKVVNIFENSSVTIYCGSSSPVKWSYVPYVKNDPFSEIEFTISMRHRRGYKNISLINLLHNESGIYTCEGTHGNHFFRKSLYVLVDLARVGQVIPNWIEVPSGNSVKLSCMSFNRAEWFGINIHNQNATQLNELILYNIRVEDSGPYVCRGFRHGLNVFHAYAHVIVDGYVDRISTIEPLEPIPGLEQ